MIGFFIVRRMIELNKVSSRVAKLKLNVFSAPVTKHVNKKSRFFVHENYNWDAEKSEQKAVLYICNQCIHAYISFVHRGPDRNWSDLLVVSDYDRNNVMWRIPFAAIVSLFEATSKDWPLFYQMIYDSKLDDYKVKTD